MCTEIELYEQGVGQIYLLEGLYTKQDLLDQLKVLDLMGERAKDLTKELANENDNSRK